ncbi:MAG: hypothetical protein H7263_12355 [Candidatus Sericytochromatia bacterium]|nr:hypothetical protein [Candidatus Sericytochromatia bacterium]
MSEKVFNKLKEKIELSHPEWVFNQRGDGNWSLSNRKVFAYFDYEKNGNVVCRPRIYPNNLSLREFTCWKDSVKVGKIGAWKDEVIDIPLTSESLLDDYLAILEITAYRKKVSPAIKAKVEINVPDSAIDYYANVASNAFSSSFNYLKSWVETKNIPEIVSAKLPLINEKITEIVRKEEKIIKSENFSSEEIKNLIYPLSYSYYLATESTSDLYSKLNAYFKLFEIVSTFNSLLLLSALPQVYIREYETEIWTRDKNRYSRLSMGLWIDLYRRLSNIYKEINRKDPSFLPHLPFGDAFYHALIDKNLLAILEQIPEKRNRFAHSGSNVPDGILKKEVEILKVLSEKVFERLIVYKPLWLVYPISMKKKKGVYETSIKYLNSLVSTPFPEKRIQLSEAMESESLYLFKADSQECLRLFPEFINLFECGDCGHWSLYIFDKMDRKIAEYYSFHNIHHIHKTEINGLLNMFV